MDQPIHVPPVLAHHAPGAAGPAQASAKVTPAPVKPGLISGQGVMKFRVFRTADILPEQARQVLVSAHGGFAVDRRPGKGETYFALPGAGILQISADLKSARINPTPEEVKGANLHNTAIWYAPNGNAYLIFAANTMGKIFTTSLDGKLIHTLNAPSPDHDFDQPEIKDYFMGKGNFVPTSVEYLDGRYYITTGYSNLDYVLTAEVLGTTPFDANWSDLAFGGKGEGEAQFGTAHGIAVPPGIKRLDISDRPHSRIQRFTRHGHFRSSLKMPNGSLPCDVDYLDQYAVVACLEGPDKSQGAPVYVLENDKLISTVMPKEELGLANFVHNHNAVLHKREGKYYIIVQAWNPGDFAILEQTGE